MEYSILIIVYNSNFYNYSFIGVEYSFFSYLLCIYHVHNVAGTVKMKVMKKSWNRPSGNVVYWLGDMREHKSLQ